MAASIVKFRFLTASQVKDLYRVFIANAEPTQPGLLESAVQSPMNTKYYVPNSTLFQLAATLSEKIMKNHAFSDGNKRAALLSADMFLKINGYQLQQQPMAQDEVNEQIAAAHVAVTTGEWSAEQLAQYYASISKPITRWTPDILSYRDNATEG